MNTSIAWGVLVLGVTGITLAARAEPLPSSSSAAATSAAPTVQNPASTVQNSPTAPEPQPALQPLPPTSDGAPLSGTSAVVNPSAPTVASSPSAPSAPGTKPTATQSPKDADGESDWPKMKPCLSPDSEDGKELSTNCSGVFGLRGSITRSRGVGPNDALGLSVSTEGEEYVRRGIWTARGLHRLAIGGGAAGFEGILQGGWAGGVRLPIAPCRRHGPVLRLGMYGYLRGNDDYYGSLLELPQLQFGYQYMRGKIVIELGGTAGAVLVGRSRTGDSARRVLGTGFERGGYLALQFPWFRVGVSGNRLPVNDSLSTPVDVFEGSFCVRVRGFALCSDARATTTDAIVATGDPAAEVRALYAGVTLGMTRE